MSYRTTEEFLRMFGYSSLNDLPELPRYKMDENHQIVIDELEEKNEEDSESNKDIVVQDEIINKDEEENN